MTFRQATLHDFPEIMHIIEDAVSRMQREGKHQWSEDYPKDVHILVDISRGFGHVLHDDEAVVAYGAVCFEGEPAYEHLDGEWLTDGPYVVVHRLAVKLDEQSKGVGRRFMKAVEDFAASRGMGSFRIDTNYDNDRMLHLLENLGFEFTGIINYPQGERRAFEKLI